MYCSGLTRCISLQFLQVAHDGVSFRDSNGTFVYAARYDRIDHVLNWAWKELLMSSVVRQQTDAARAIRRAIQLLGVEREVFDLFPAKGSEWPALAFVVFVG